MISGTPALGSCSFHSTPTPLPCCPGLAPAAQEYLLHLLLQPRHRYAELAEEEDEAYDDFGGDGGEGGNDMHRSKSGERLAGACEACGG